MPLLTDSPSAKGSAGALQFSLTLALRDAMSRSVNQPTTTQQKRDVRLSLLALVPALLVIYALLAQSLLAQSTPTPAPLPRVVAATQLYAIDQNNSRTTAPAATMLLPRNSIYTTPPAEEIKGRTMYKWSVLALVAGNTADTISSWRQNEGNPVLGGSFSGQSLAIKSGLVGGAFLIERFALRHNPRLYKPFAWMNFAIGGGLGAVAVHNYQVR